MAGKVKDRVSDDRIWIYAMEFINLWLVCYLFVLFCPILDKFTSSFLQRPTSTCLAVPLLTSGGNSSISAL